MKIFIIILLLLILISYELKSQNFDDLYVDFASPDNSAYSLLSISPNSVSKPGNLKELSIQLLNMLSTVGNIPLGIAIDWSPLYSFNKTLKDYQNYSWIYRLNMSFATVKNSKSNSTDVAFGIKWIPIDNSDPYQDKNLADYIKKCLLLSDSTLKLKHNFNEKFAGFCKDSLKMDNPDILTRNIYNFENYIISSDLHMLPILYNLAIDSLQSNYIDIDSNKREQLKQLSNLFVEIVLKRFFRNKKSDILIEERKKSFKEKNWNAKSLQFSTGIIASSDSSIWKNLQLKQVGIFSGYSQNIGDWGQAILHIQYNYSWQYNLEYKNKYSIGSRFLIGNKNIRGSLEGFFSYLNKFDDKDLERTIRLTLGLEFNLSDGLWVETVLGTNSPIDRFKNGSILSIANVKYAFSKKPRYEL